MSIHETQHLELEPESESWELQETQIRIFTLVPSHIWVGEVTASHGRVSGSLKRLGEEL